jgi:hypothetical protein
MPVTTVGANGILTDIIADTLYLALLYGIPSDTDTGSTLSEITGSGYSRKVLTPATWTTPVNGVSSYNAELTWTISATWTQVAYAYALVTASTAGELVAYAYLTNPASINVAQGATTTTLVLSANSLVIEVN